MTLDLDEKPVMTEILIVEDSPTQAERLRHLLEQHLYRVTLASTGEQALVYLNQTLPAMIISDINMPGMNGFELCQQLKTSERTSDIPVVLLTSLSNAQDVVDALACGANGFITKPYSEDYLLTYVARTLAKKSAVVKTRTSIEVEINLAGKSRVITASPDQTVSLLLSTFEAAIHRNTELLQAQDELSSLNEHLEDLVAVRTAALSEEIVQRKWAAAALEDSERRFATLFHASPAAISLNAISDGRVIDVNEAFENLLGFSRHEVIGRTADELRLWPTSDGQKKIVDLLLQRRSLHGIEISYRRKSGEMVDTLSSLEIITLGGDDYIIGLSQDITQLKFAQAAVRASEERFQLVAHATNDAIWDRDMLTDRIWWNDSFYSLFGYNEGEVLVDYAFWLEAVHPDDRGRVKNILKAVQQAGDSTWSLEYRFRHHDGSYRNILDRGTMVRDADGGLVRTAGSMVDLTERKQADEKIHFQAHLLDTVGQSVIATDLEGRIIYWNRFAETLYGWSATQAMGQNVNDVTAADGTANSQGAEIFANLRAGRSWTGEFMVHHRDGTTFPALVSDSPILAEDGTLIGVVGISSDISELKRREHELEALAEASSRLRMVSSRAEMPAVILDLLMELFKAEGASLVIHDSAAGEWLVELGRGNLASATGTRHPHTAGLSGKVIASGELYLSDNITADPQLVPLVDMMEPLSSAGAPLVAQSKTIGVLWIGRRNLITAADARLLTSVADIAANAMQRASLHSQTERGLRQLQALHAIDQAIKSSLDLKLTLTLLLEHITGQLQVDAACILLADQHSRVLELVVSRGFRTKVPNPPRIRFGEGYAGQVALNRRSIYIANLTEQVDNPRLVQGLQGEGFIGYYAIPLSAKGQVKGVLEIFHRSVFRPDEECLQFLEALADQSAIAIDSAQLFADLQRTNADLLMAYNATIEGWSRALDLRDKETEGHSQRVTQMTLDLAQAMGGFNDSDFTFIRWGALLHDIGKMGVPDHILLKPGKLTDEEWDLMQRHSTYAFNLLEPIAYLRPALDIPHYHHEKWDGTGYPDSLIGNRIPRSARIFAVVDVWDALRSDRPYRPAWDEARIIAHIRSLSGTHFDPQVVEAFMKIIDHA